VLFNYSSNSVSDGDAWYYPRRHDYFLYDSSGKVPIGVNPEFYTYSPDSSNSNYNINHHMPSFSCVSAPNRKTNEIPNGGCNPCTECWTHNGFGGNPYSGCASGPRYIAITPVHVISVDHYYARPASIGNKIKFFSSTGDQWQKVIFRERFPIGSGSHGDDGTTPPSDNSPPGEITILEVQAAAQGTSPSDSEYNTVLGDNIEAPDIDIKYPFFMPRIGMGNDPLKYHIINNMVGLTVDQDVRCHVVGLGVESISASKSGISLRSIGVSKNEYGDINLQYLKNKNLAILEDMGGAWVTNGDSGSGYFTYDKVLTKDSPILLGQRSGGNQLVNQFHNYIIDIVKDYDTNNGTSYADDLINRIITREQLGVDDYLYESISESNIKTIDLLPIWSDKEIKNETKGMPVGDIIEDNNWFILDPAFNRIVSFEIHNDSSLSWSESEWDLDDITIKSLNKNNYTIFNEHIYVCCNYTSVYGNSSNVHYPDINPGIVYKFKINSNNTTEYYGALFAPDGIIAPNLTQYISNPMEYFGHSITSNSTDLFISAGVDLEVGTQYGFSPWDPIYGYPNPTVYVYHNVNDQLVFKQKIQPDGFSPSDDLYYTERFGYSLACNNQWLFIGNNTYDIDEIKNSVYVFRKDDLDKWVQHQIIEDPTFGDGDEYNWFGQNIIINEKTLLISSQKYRVNESDPSMGGVITYKFNSQSNQWLKDDVIDNNYKKDLYALIENSLSMVVPSPEFGSSIDKDGSIIVSAAPKSMSGISDDNFTFYKNNNDISNMELSKNSGVVSVFRLNDRTNEWDEIYVFDSLSYPEYEFGSSVSIKSIKDEYERISKNYILSLENFTNINDLKDLYSGGKMIIINYNYGTFPINKNASKLKGLGQSFNTKLIPTYTKTIPFINTSTSANGIVSLPFELHPAYLTVFDKYAKITTPNRRAIHIMIQDRVDEFEVVYLRETLSEILKDKPGSLYGADKSDITNGMGYSDVIIGIFNNRTEEESSDALFLSGEFNINISTINQDNIFINKFLNTNKTIRTLIDPLYRYGIYENSTAIKTALNLARIQAESSGNIRPESPSYFSQTQQNNMESIFHPGTTNEEAKNIRYLTLGVEVYYGMWEHDPNADGTSGENEYDITSKSQMQVEDPDLYSIVNGFFPEDLTV